jgi:hypothetical protein
MAKGKYKASAEKRIESETIEQLTRKVQELTEENQQLKKQADQDHMHHAFQIAEMHSQVQKAVSPRIEQLEAEVLRLKKALRGV